MPLNLFSLTAGTNEDARFLITRGADGELWLRRLHPTDPDLGAVNIHDIVLPPDIEGLSYEVTQAMPREVQIIFDSFVSAVDFEAYRTANLNIKSLFIGALDSQDEVEVYELPLSESVLLTKPYRFIRVDGDLVRVDGDQARLREP